MFEIIEVVSFNNFVIERGSIESVAIKFNSYDGTNNVCDNKYFRDCVI